MISVDVCEKKSVRHDVAPHQIQEWIQSNGSGGDAQSDEQKPVLWVDISAPTEDDWKQLESQFHFHPLAIEDARTQGQRAKVDMYEGYLYLAVKAWQGDEKPTDTEDVEEIDVFLGPNYLVTIHPDGVSAIEETRKRMQKHPDRLGRHSAHLLYLLLDAIVDQYFPVMDALDEDIDDMETEVYGEDLRHKPFHVGPALKLKRRLLLLRQAVAPMRDVLNALQRTDDTNLIPPDLMLFYQDVYDHTLRLTEQIDLHRDLLSGVLDAIVAQTSNRLNQVMKTMTAISTILMSVALVSGVYGMNFKRMPELDWHYGYEYALGLMVVITAGLVAYFKYIDWL